MGVNYEAQPIIQPPFSKYMLIFHHAEQVVKLNLSEEEFSIDGEITIGKSPGISPQLLESQGMSDNVGIECIGYEVLKDIPAVCSNRKLLLVVLIVRCVRLSNC